MRPSAHRRSVSASAASAIAVTAAPRFRLPPGRPWSPPRARSSVRAGGLVHARVDEDRVHAVQAQALPQVGVLTPSLSSVADEQNRLRPLHPFPLRCSGPTLTYSRGHEAGYEFHRPRAGRPRLGRPAGPRARRPLPARAAIDGREGDATRARDRQDRPITARYKAPSDRGGRRASGGPSCGRRRATLVGRARRRPHHVATRRAADGTRVRWRPTCDHRPGRAVRRGVLMQDVSAKFAARRVLAGLMVEEQAPEAAPASAARPPPPGPPRRAGEDRPRPAPASPPPPRPTDESSTSRGDEAATPVLKRVRRWPPGPPACCCPALAKAPLSADTSCMPHRSSRTLATLSATFWVLVLAVVVLFAFFVALGAFSPGEVVGLTIGVAVLALLWMGHAVWDSRHRDPHDPAMVRARERRASNPGPLACRGWPYAQPPPASGPVRRHGRRQPRGAADRPREGVPCHRCRGQPLSRPPPPASGTEHRPRPEEVADAVAEQIRTLERTPRSASSATSPPTRLTERLASEAPMADARVFLASGGGDAIDTARRSPAATGCCAGAERVHLISRTQGYHGTHGFGTSLGGIEANVTNWARSCRTSPRSPSTPFRARSRDPARRAGACGRVLLRARDRRRRRVPPPDGYIEGVADCALSTACCSSSTGICGFGRLGTWFGIDAGGGAAGPDHVPKGVTSGYLPGGVIASAMWQRRSLRRAGRPDAPPRRALRRPPDVPARRRSPCSRSTTART